jgi:hypothetical protein
MAAGTMRDPFSKYDTCIVLWPKNNRVLENREMREENLSWNRSGQLYNEGREVKLTEDELKQVIKEAAIKLIR